MTLAATLVTDGSSDRVLVPILNWLLSESTSSPVEVRWANLQPTPPRLCDRITRAVELYPCDLLFIHRDAEKQEPTFRHDEILNNNKTGCLHVCVVPVRMQEAWLLHDELALREAAGRPSGSENLNLPVLNRVESLPDPKAVLHTALRIASNTKGRRAKKFKPNQAAHRLAELISDWSPLRELTAFQQLESDTRAALSKLGLALLT